MKISHHHLPRLDSLRGIAALTVGASHTFNLPAPGTWGALLFFPIDGRLAVSTFFILSGLVLGMSLQREGAASLGGCAAFLTRRFFRLYPAYAISTLPYLGLLFLLTARVHRGEPVGDGFFNSHFNVYSNSFPSWMTLFENFIFADQLLNGVTWTLKVEAYAAFLLPLLHLFSTVLNWTSRLALLIVLVIISLCSAGNTSVYLYLFYLGYLLPAILAKFRAITLLRPRLIHGLMLVVITSTFLASHEFPPQGPGRQFGVFFAAVGSFTLLGLLLAGSAFDETIFRPLDHPILRFLGAISYSFYLLYPLGMDAGQRLVAGLAAKQLLTQNQILLELLVFAIAVAIAVGLGYLSHRFVEKSFIRLGAHFYSRRDQGLPGAPRLHAAEGG